MNNKWTKCYKIIYGIEKNSILFVQNTYNEKKKKCKKKLYSCMYDLIFVNFEFLIKKKLIYLKKLNEM
jgi:hypothetical protein